MRPRFIPDQHDWADSVLDPNADGGDTSFLPSALDDGGQPLANAALEILPTPSLSSEAVAPAGGQGGADDAAAPLPEGNVADQTDGAVADSAAPGAGSVTEAIMFASALSVPAPAVLADPEAGIVGAHIAEAGTGYGGALQALAHADDYQLFQIGLHAAAPAGGGDLATAAVSAPLGSTLAPMVLANLANSSGPVTDASVGSHGATAAQVQQALDESGLSVNGAGIKVGVLSDSFNQLGGAATDEADGALPSTGVQVLQEDPYSGGTDEGRAMLQIIHDIAPGASLAFATAEGGDQAFANNILALAAAGCKVIVDDAFYYDEPFFQSGVIAQAIQTVEAEGVTYVAAAGNNASNGYQAAWTPMSGSFDGIPLTDAESFGGSVVQTVTINTGETGDGVPLVLEWNQPYGAATSDLEVVVFRNGILYGEYSNRNAGQELNNPLVVVPLPGTGIYQIAIENLSGPNPGLIKEITEGNGFPATISGANEGTVVGHAMTPGAITAGAVSAADTPAFGFSPTSESFSSSGAGAELLFASNGTALSSPDMLNPVVVSGVDDVATTVSQELGDFYGTSAASASLAGVAALMLAANPDLTPAQVEQIMEETAAPMSNSAVSGAGLVQVDAAVAAANLAPMVTVANIALSAGHGSVAASSLFTATDPGESAIATYGFIDETGSGHFVLNGVAQASDQEIDVSASQLSQLTYQSAPGSVDTLEVRASNGVWSSWESFTVTAPPLVIQTDGSTALTELGNNFYLDTGGAGPELKSGGAVVTAGEYGGWIPIGAIQVAGGYDVAWEIPGANQYSVWSTDSNGNYLSNPVAPGSPGSSLALEAIESVFHQDLNGDGIIGIPTVVIQTDGSTALTEIGNNFYLFNGGTGPELKSGGAAVTAGEYGGWIPIGAIQVAGGYDVAWEIPGANQYSVWATDSNGNYLSNPVAPGSPGSSLALEAIESVFHQDLNGDGIIGIPTVVIQTDGSTALTEIGNNFYLYDGGTGPELKSGGAAVTAGEYGGWIPIGAIQVAGGYDVAWEIPGANQYSVWATDSNGNYLSNPVAPGSPGSSLALEAIESVFHQDLNGAGTIGIPTVVIQTDGSTALTEIGNNFYLYDGGTGPELKSGGAAVTAGEYGGWIPIGAIQVAGGYDVAWEIPGANQYSVWSTDSNGNYLSNPVAPGSPGSSLALEAIESVFHQDLNGDGTIGIPSNSASATLASAASADTVTFAGSPGILTVETPSTFSGEIIGFTGNGSLAGSDQIDLRGMNFATVESSYNTSTGVLDVNDGTTTSDIQFLGNYSQQSFKFADDSSGGITVYVSPASSPATPVGGPMSATAGTTPQLSVQASHDIFVFAPNFGQITLKNFAPATDTIQISPSVFANLSALLAMTHDNAQGNAVMTDAAHDTITFQNVTTAQLLAHQSDFHFV